MAAGDHIFVYVGVYSHHGIDCGDGTVIHFDSTPWQKFTGRYAVDRPPMIRRVPWEEFVRDRDVTIRIYESADAPDQILARAASRLGERGYHLFDNNCEHFAVWCRTGTPGSSQVRSVVDATRPMVRNLPLAAALLRSTRYLPGRARLAAVGAAFTVTAGFAAARYVRNRLDNFLANES